MRSACRPACARPRSKAGATRVYHYRAYPEIAVEASTFDLADVGDEWVFGGWLKGEEQWIHAAFTFAARSDLQNNPQ
jgi:hypothetical protein